MTESRFARLHAHQGRREQDAGRAVRAAHDEAARAETALHAARAACSRYEALRAATETALYDAAHGAVLNLYAFEDLTRRLADMLTEEQALYARAETAQASLEAARANLHAAQEHYRAERRRLSKLDYVVDQHARRASWRAEILAEQEWEDVARAPASGR